nr:hypothetical protein [Tanacetum cinerariifolium]
VRVSIFTKANVCAFCKPYWLGFSFAFVASFVLRSDANVTKKHKKVSVNENTIVNAYDELYVNTASVLRAACFENIEETLEMALIADFVWDLIHGFSMKVSTAREIEALTTASQETPGDLTTGDRLSPKVKVFLIPVIGFSFAFVASFVLGSDANVTKKHKKVSVNENTIVNAYDELYVNTAGVLRVACFENTVYINAAIGNVNVT